MEFEIDTNNWCGVIDLQFSTELLILSLDRPMFVEFCEILSPKIAGLGNRCWQVIAQEAAPQLVEAIRAAEY